MNWPVKTKPKAAVKFYVALPLDAAALPLTQTHEFTIQNLPKKK